MGGKMSARIKEKRLTGRAYRPGTQACSNDFKNVKGRSTGHRLFSYLIGKMLNVRNVLGEEEEWGEGGKIKRDL